MKLMAFTGKSNTRAKLVINVKFIEQVKTCNYLGYTSL